MLPQGGAVDHNHGGLLFFLFMVSGSRFQVSDIDSFLEPFSNNLIFSIHYTISLKTEMNYSNYQATIIFKAANFQIDLFEGPRFSFLSSEAKAQQAAAP